MSNFSLRLFVLAISAAPFLMSAHAQVECSECATQIIFTKSDWDCAKRAIATTKHVDSNPIPFVVYRAPTCTIDLASIQAYLPRQTDDEVEENSDTPPSEPLPKAVLAQTISADTATCLRKKVDDIDLIFRDNIESVTVDLENCQLS